MAVTREFQAGEVQKRSLTLSDRLSVLGAGLLGLPCLWAAHELSVRCHALCFYSLSRTVLLSV